MMDCSGNTYDVLAHDVELAQAVQKTRIPNLYILPSTTSLAGAEGCELVNQPRREYRAPREL